MTGALGGRPRRRGRWPRRLALGLLLAGLAAAFWLWSLGGEVDEHVLARWSAPVRVERGPVVDVAPGIVSQSVSLEAESGLAFDLRILRPHPRLKPMPLVVLLGGHRTGRDAVELVGDPHGAIVAALDYPYRGPERPRGLRQRWQAIRSLRPALHDTPAAVLTAIDFLLEEPAVEPDRVELMGVSLGVPFAATAAALDPRVTRLWLIHGGGDNRLWLEHALESRIPLRALRRPVAALLNHLAKGRSLDAARRVGALDGRPLVLVAAQEDQRLPGASLQALLDAAQPPVELIWTVGAHVNPRRPELVRALVAQILVHLQPPSAGD